MHGGKRAGAGRPRGSKDGAKEKKRLKRAAVSTKKAVNVLKNEGIVDLFPGDAHAPTPLLGRNVHGNAGDGPKLYPRMALFAKEFTKDFNIKQSAIRAGYAESGAYNTGFTLLRRPDVEELINIELRKRAERVDVSIDQIAKYWRNLATVDPRRLTPRGSCRHCWGIDFGHQYTLNEMRDANRQHQKDQLRIKDFTRRCEFDEQGGDGYDKFRDPNPNCPECNGHGIRVIDLDSLSEDEAALIASLTVSKTGEVTSLKFRDQSRAMENLQVLLGYVRPRKLIEVFDPDNEAQVDAVLEALDERGLLPPPDGVDARVVEHEADPVD